MYSYFITDEPSASAFPALGKLVAYLRQRDPAHLAYINLFPTYANNEQLGTKGDTVTAYREHLRQYHRQSSGRTWSATTTTSSPWTATTRTTSSTWR